MTDEEVARLCVSEYWQLSTRCAVVTSTLRVPGRGQSSTGSNLGGWRTEDRQAVLTRLDRVVAELVQGLAADALSIEQARNRATEAGFGGAIRVTASADELTALIAEVMRSGDNVWVDCSPIGGGVVYLKFWYDRSHP